MSTQGRGVSKPDLDHLDWVEEAAARERTRARERRAGERRASAAAPARGRQSERPGATHRECSTSNRNRLSSLQQTKETTE